MTSSAPPITRTIRGIRSEPEQCVIACDSLVTIPIGDLDPEPVGTLDEIKRSELDRALRYALDIVY